MGKEISITLNGEARAVEAGTTVASLVQAITHDPSRVAVERNRKIVPRASWETAAVDHGDEIEVVTLVGGG
jgi:thiamine biosynthesis protein ThiS